jgi:hypothetical protein
MNTEQYVATLENVIQQMMKPLRDIPLSLVIEVLSGHSVILFNSNDSQDRQLLATLVIVARQAGHAINKQGIVSKRANEVGNYVEPFVLNALNEQGFEAQVPQTRSGKKKANGSRGPRRYPQYLWCGRLQNSFHSRSTGRCQVRVQLR